MDIDRFQELQVLDISNNEFPDLPRKLGNLHGLNALILEWFEYAFPKLPRDLPPFKIRFLQKELVVSAQERMPLMKVLEMMSINREQIGTQPTQQTQLA